MAKYAIRCLVCGDPVAPFESSVPMARLCGPCRLAICAWREKYELGKTVSRCGGQLGGKKNEFDGTPKKV